MKLAYRQATALLTCVANDARLQIMCQIANNAKSVGDIALAVGLSHSAASQHLKRLREAELVYFTRHEKEVYYMLAPGIAGNLIGFLEANFPSLVAQNSNEQNAHATERQKSA